VGSTQKNKGEVGKKYSASSRIRGIPLLIGRPLHVIFVGDKSMSLEVL
jgi:hypothetical protein